MSSKDSKSTAGTSSKSSGANDKARSESANTPGPTSTGSGASGGNGGGAVPGKPAGASQDQRTTDGSGPTQGADADHVVTESGRNVGSWPDNGQPQKAGEPGEKSPETESAPPEGEEPKDPPTLNPQKAGEPGEAKPSSATTEDTTSDGESAQGDRQANPGEQQLTNSERKLARVNNQLAALTKQRDQLIVEVDAEKAAGDGKQRISTHDAYTQYIDRQRANRRDRQSVFAQVQQAAGGGEIPTSPRAPVDQRGRR